MTNAYKLACSTVAKRAKLAAQIEALASRVGAEITEDIEYNHERMMALALGPYRVCFEFEGRTKMASFLASWYTRGNAARYPADFPAASVNQYHFGKATVIEDSFADFVDTLERGFIRLQSILQLEELERTVVL